MKLISKVLVVLITVILISCRAQETFKTKKLELRQLVQSTDISTKTSGGYFLIAGSFSSTQETTVSVKVFAKTEKYYQLIDMPIEDIRINIDNTLEKPNVQIQYDWLEE